MPQGDKAKYTDKQKRKAEHIAEGYQERGTPHDEAERIAWSTVNRDSGGGNKSGSGRGVPDTHGSAKRGGEAASGRTEAQRSASARKVAATRKRNREKANA